MNTESFHQINAVDKKVTVCGGLNEGKGLFGTFILVKRQREVYQEHGITWGRGEYNQDFSQNIFATI